MTTEQGHVMVNLRFDVHDSKQLLKLGRAAYLRSVPEAHDVKAVIPNVENAIVELLVEAWMVTAHFREGHDAVEWGDVDNKEFFPQ